MAALDDQRTLVAGGSDSSGLLRDAYIYNWVTGIWQQVASMRRAREVKIFFGGDVHKENK